MYRRGGGLGLSMSYIRSTFVFAPLGDGTLATRMGPAHQNSDRRASSYDLLGFSRRGGQYAARSNARWEQLRIAAAAAVALQRFDRL